MLGRFVKIKELVAQEWIGLMDWHSLTPKLESPLNFHKPALRILFATVLRDFNSAHRNGHTPASAPSWALSRYGCWRRPFGYLVIPSRQRRHFGFLVLVSFVFAQLIQVFSAAKRIFDFNSDRNLVAFVLLLDLFHYLLVLLGLQRFQFLNGIELVFMLATHQNCDVSFVCRAERPIGLDLALVEIWGSGLIDLVFVVETKHLLVEYEVVHKTGDMIHDDIISLVQ